MGNGRVSKDEALENAIITSLKNPRHCLYFKEKRAIAKTIINSAEIYELELSKKYETSVNAHEHVHVISANQTQFKRIMVLECVNPALRIAKFLLPLKVKLDRALTDFYLIYSSEVYPFLEAFAILYQCKLQATPSELKEHLLGELYRTNPALLALVVDIDDVFDRIMEKYRGGKKTTVRAIGEEIDKAHLDAAIFAMIMNLVFSTPDIVKERVFDRFRILREIEKIPEWRGYEEIMKHFRNYFHENGLSVSFMPLGTPESIIGAATFLHELKKLELSQEDLEPYIFGLLSEIDTQFGRITYVCDSLKTLEGKRIKKCYMGSISSNILFSSIDVTIRNIDEMLRDEKYRIYAEYFNLVKEFRNDLVRLRQIKENIFRKCPREKHCIGRKDCAIREELCKEVLEKILKR